MPKTDVLVAGGGHNGLVAAILAASGGLRVTVIERSAQVGGATVSAAVFTGHRARLSRYSYLVSLFPTELVRRLGIRLELASRDVASYTPVVRHGRPTGLLVEREPGSATAQSFRDLTGSGSEFESWQRWYGELARLAAVVAPVLQGPLRRRSQVRDAVVAAVGSSLWDEVFEAPIGAAITQRFRDDTVRGVVATDALIGTFTSVFDESLLANRCFPYHLIGRGTGEWLVPVGGMGALTAVLVGRALQLGVEFLTDTEVTDVVEDEAGVTVVAQTASGERSMEAAWLLAAVAPTVVGRWRREQARSPTGSQLKINLLFKTTPQLASGLDPRTAFAGTTHLEEGFDQLESAFRLATAGTLPDELPGEVYATR